MTTPPSSEFSYDLYPGLDADLVAALARNIANGAADQAAVATAGLAAAIGNTISQSQPTAEWESPVVEQWAESELSTATLGWRRYFSSPMATVERPNLMTSHVATLNRLYNAQQALLESGEKTTRSGYSIGQVMHLTLVPWQQLSDNLDQLPEWIKSLREYQGGSFDNDYFHTDLLEQLQNDTPIYRNPKAANQNLAGNSTEPQWLSARQYLTQRLEEDGPWGIVLIQNTEDAGISSLADKSPDDLTAQGNGHFEIAGQQVDGLGVFEYLALTMQHDGYSFSTNNRSFMLANRLLVRNIPMVAFGGWDKDRLRVTLGVNPADNSLGEITPRLAVI